MNELDALLSLNAVPGLGNIRLRKLIDRFGTARKILSLNERELAAEGLISTQIARSIFEFDRDRYLKDEDALINKHCVEVISYQDDDYPQNLKNIPDAPVLLYFKGKLKKEENLSIAIVGSRRASLYGRSMAEKFALGLAELDFTIVSGMARGIDSAAHLGALKAKGSTMAVLGCGLSHIYPPENKRLMEKIIDSGAVVSEFSMATPPYAYNFPRRNRIISGLSLGVLVVEASLKSGALITSKMALEQGREVFAIPGKVDSPNSVGVHHLIQEGAKLVGHVNDILEELAPQIKIVLQNAETQKNADHRSNRLLDEKQQDIYQLINDVPVHIDEVVHRCGRSIATVMGILLQLELKGLIRQLPGKMFIR